MDDHNGYHFPPSSGFSTAFGDYKELHLSPNENNAGHSLALSSWPVDETSQYFADAGCPPFDGAQAVIADPRFTSMEEFMGSFQADLLNSNVRNDYQFQDLAQRAGLLCFGESQNMENCFARDFGVNTAVSSLANCALAQDHTCKTQGLNGKDFAIQSLEPSKPSSSFDSKQRRKASRGELASRDNHRRSVTTKWIQDLEKLLPPHSAKNQWEVVNKSVEYVKHLQLQLKELSQNKLMTETHSDPFISLKGFGFHHLPQRTLEELKDEFGALVQENPTAAMELLESRGLLEVPMELVKALPVTE